MTNDEGNREVPIQNIPTDDEEPVQNGRLFIRSLIRAGVSLAAIPINLIPDESQEIIQDAGKELALGLVGLSRQVADILEGMVEEVDSEQ